MLMTGAIKMALTQKGRRMVQKSLLNSPVLGLPLSTKPRSAKRMRTVRKRKLKKKLWLKRWAIVKRAMKSSWHQNSLSESSLEARTRKMPWKGVNIAGNRAVQMYRSNSEYLVRNPVEAALQSNKRLKAKHFFFFNIFGLAWPWDPRGPGTNSRFVQSPLMIDLWMEECPTLMIFSYFWWKWRWSPSQD